MTDPSQIKPEELADREAWSRSRLSVAGFEGWVTFSELADRLPKVPRTGGVYVVSRDGTKPDFLSASTGGHFKGRDPSVSRDALDANWVDGAPVVYIGKADNLRRRLQEFMHFGAGEPVGHWGGRLIWQLRDSGSLLVAWVETPSRIPREVEVQMIDAFKAAWRKPPFANEPHRLGV
jgi:hypothetical protein